MATGKILKTNIGKELAALSKTLRAAETHIRRAGNLAINQGLQTFNTQTTKAIRIEVNLTARELKEKLFRKYPARGMGLTASFTAVISPINVIHFVVNPKDKQPVPQKGIPVRRRKKIKIRIFRGQTLTLPKSFIARLPGKQGSSAIGFGNVHLMRRTSTQKLPINKRAGFSLYKFFKDDAFMRPIIKTTDARVRVFFGKKLKFLVLSEAKRNLGKNLNKIIG